MKRLLYLPILMAAAVFLIAACSSDSSTPAAAPVDNTITITDLTGSTWETGCLVEDLTDSIEVTLTFTAGAPDIFSFALTFYAGSTTCNAAAPFSFSEVLAGTFVFNGEQTASNRIVSRIDSTDTSDEVTPVDAATATAMNTDTAWGLTGWAAGVPQSVLGFEFDGTPVATTFMDLFGVDSSTNPDTLFIGDEDAAVDADGYPTALDLVFVFTRM